MKTRLHFQEIEGLSLWYYVLIGILGLIVLSALGAAYYMEHNGHHVTGMTNQIVWGIPHVFAVFLIVAASGALNVASIGSVFNIKVYKPLSRLSGLLAICLLIGGLCVLVLDLGRPDRIITAMTHYNFKSIFAWNIYLYTGFFGVVGVYLWVQMERRMNKYTKMAGTLAFVWRLALTTGTGSIFGFLVARQAYDAAIMAPMFIVMSFSFGLAIYILVLMWTYRWIERPLGDYILYRLKNLLGIFVAAVLYFVTAYHLTNIYVTEHHGVERFILLDGGIYTRLFWFVQIFIGSILPLILVFHPTLSKSRFMIGVAAFFVIIGGLAQVYIIIIGGQAYPLTLFPGKEIITSGFFDGVAGMPHLYIPTLAETVLGIGGIGIALIMVAICVKFLHFLPESLADEIVDPHHVKA